MPSCGIKSLRDQLRFSDTMPWSYETPNEDHYSSHRDGDVEQCFAEHLSKEWSCSSFRIPESFFNVTSIMSPRSSNNHSPADLMLDLATIQLSPLRKHCSPLSDAQTWHATYDTQSYIPDFCFQPHTGCTRWFECGGLSGSPHEPNIIRVLDLLRCESGMISVTQSIINTFASHPEYGLRVSAPSFFPWLPSYENHSQLQKAVTVVPRTICHMLPVTQRKAYHSPMTMLEPALLLIAVELERGDIPDMADLRRLAKALDPHLQALLMALHSSRIRDPSHEPLIPHDRKPVLPHWFTIFGLIIRQNAVHVISHTPTQTENGWLFRSRLVDSLPYTTHIETESDLQCRLRLASALLVLQKHLRSLSGLYEDIVWPQTLSDAHRCICDDWTGIRSPCPSDDLTGDSECAGDEPAEEGPNEEQIVRIIDASRHRAESWTKCLPEYFAPVAEAEAFISDCDNTALTGASTSKALYKMGSLDVTKSSDRNTIWSHPFHADFGVTCDDCVFEDDAKGLIHRHSQRKRFINASTSASAIVSFIVDVSGKWMKGAVRISNLYRMVSDSIDLGKIVNQECVRRYTLALYLDTLEECASNLLYPPRVEWVSDVDAVPPDWPEPDLSFISPTRREDHPRIDLCRVFMDLLRYPTYFEGTPEYGIDGIIQDAIIRLFNLDGVMFQLSDDDERRVLTPGMDVPCWRERNEQTVKDAIIVANFNRNHNEARREIARAAFSRLSNLLQAYYEVNGYEYDRAAQRDCHHDWLPMDAQPEHNFVYGIHCADGGVWVYAHFATLTIDDRNDVSRQWKFHQSPVVTYCTEYSSRRLSDPSLLLSYVMIQRWQLIITLFTLRRYIAEFHERRSPSPIS